MVLVSILMLMMKVSTASADTNVNVSSTDDFDWTPVMEAIIQVESEGPQSKEWKFCRCYADYSYLSGRV